MFQLTVLGSGSAGNCAVVATENCRLLIDAGLSAKQIIERLEFAGVAPHELDGILLTHEHGDHIRGLEVFCKKFAIPIFTNKQTLEEIKLVCRTEHFNWQVFTTGHEFSVKDITVESFPVTHDAVEPVGFAVYHGGFSFGFITDLGIATKLVRERLRRVSALVIEANYDEKMLKNDVRRPWAVKQRIQWQHGHLSNDAAADVVKELAGHNLRRAILGHLSRDCNTPELALATVQARLQEAGGALEVFCASQTEVSPRFRVDG